MPQSTSDSEPTETGLTEEQIDKKLEQFAGAMGELDEATQEKVGRLLMKPEDEDIDAND